MQSTFYIQSTFHIDPKVAAHVQCTFYSDLKGQHMYSVFSTFYSRWQHTQSTFYSDLKVAAHVHCIFYIDLKVAANVQWTFYI